MPSVESPGPQSERTAPVAPPETTLGTDHLLVAARYHGFAGGFSPSRQHLPLFKYATKSLMSDSDMVVLKEGIREFPFLITSVTLASSTGSPVVNRVLRLKRFSR